jgi:ABC-2 type transport system permease protein
MSFNYIGCWALFIKEVRRFYSVAVQTIFAPVISSLLFLLIFGQVVSSEITAFEGVNYSQFLIPGLVMMTILQNAFANSSSSLIQAKVYGNINFVLLSPISPLEFYLAFVAASVVRGVAVGLGVLVIGWLAFDVQIINPLVVIVFAILASALMGSIGVAAGIISDKYDQLSAFQNFLIVPLTFLSGVFYSIKSLPETWQFISHFNPFFYMVDGFRYGFFNQGDISIVFSLLVTIIFFLGITMINLILLYKGVKIRN